MTQRPVLIGLSARLFHPEAGSSGIRTKTLQYLEQSVAHWVISRDVMVVMIPSVISNGPFLRSSIQLRHYAEALDALVLQGGADIDPSAYGESPLGPDWQRDPVRDAYEMVLLREFLTLNKPVLAICRGCQLLNVAFGGNLYQDIATQLPEAQPHVAASYDKHHHSISLAPGSLLARLYPHTHFTVNSIHHQSIKRLGEHLVVEATAPDGVIEAVRSTAHDFCLGLQWHPEFHPGEPHLMDPTPILDAFVDATRRRMETAMTG